MTFLLLSKSAFKIVRLKNVILREIFPSLQINEKMIFMTELETVN
jgi:hypothetical protein